MNGEELTPPLQQDAAAAFAGIGRLLHATPRALSLTRRRHAGSAPSRDGRPRQAFDPAGSGGTEAPRHVPYVVRDALVGDADAPLTGTAKVASGYVESVLGHATAIDAKIQLLNRQWEDIVHKLVVSVLTKAQEDQNGASRNYYDIE